MPRTLSWWNTRAHRSIWIRRGGEGGNVTQESARSHTLTCFDDLPKPAPNSKTCLFATSVGRRCSRRRMPSPTLVAEHRNRPGHDDDDDAYTNVKTYYGQEDGIHRGNRNTEHDGGLVRHMIAL